MDDTPLYLGVLAVIRVLSESTRLIIAGNKNADANDADECEVVVLAVAAIAERLSTPWSVHQAKYSANPMEGAGYAFETRKIPKNNLIQYQDGDGCWQTSEASRSHRDAQGREGPQAQA